MDSKVGTALAGYEGQAGIIAGKLIEVSEHLKRLQRETQRDPDIKWQHIVSTFGSVDMHIYSLQKEIKEFLRYYVLRPSDHCPPPPDIDVPVWLSTRSHVEMESLEKDLLDAARQLPNYPDQEELRSVVSRVNKSVSTIADVCDWKVEEFKDHVKSFKSSGLEEKAWRKQAATSVNAVFAWLEDKRDGKQPR